MVKGSLDSLVNKKDYPIDYFNLKSKRAFV